MAADLLDEYSGRRLAGGAGAAGRPALVPQTVAAALGVREEPGRPLDADAGGATCGRGRLLLVLDNCEHLLAGLRRSWRRRCCGAARSVRILATSREALGIAGEQTYRVPLALPARSRARCRLPGAPDAVRGGAPLRRAGAAAPARLRGDERRTRAAVAQVCQRLDGIPLAIELAAARVKALPVEQIAARLDDRFRLLTGGSRTALPRQQTLRALIDWSYDLLSEPERALLRRLSVFAGGWTLEAAEAVCAGEWDRSDVRGPGLLTAWWRSRWCSYEERDGRGARYRLLETVRQYARDRLLEAGEAAGPCATGTATSSWGWRSEAEPKLEATRPDQADGWTGWRPSTTTCGRRWRGAAVKGATRRRGSGSRARWRRSGRCAVTGRRGSSG